MIHRSVVELSNTDEDEEAGDASDPALLACSDSQVIKDQTHHTVAADLEVFSTMLTSAQATFDATPALTLATVAAAAKIARGDADADLFTTAVVVHSVLVQTSLLRLRNVASPDSAAWTLATGSDKALQRCDELWGRALAAMAALLQQDIAQATPVLDLVDGRVFRLVCVLLASGKTAKELLAEEGEGSSAPAISKWLCQALSLSESALGVNHGPTPDASVTAIVADLKSVAATASAVAQESTLLKPLSSSQTLVHFLNDLIEPMKAFEEGPHPGMEALNPVWHNAGFNAEFRHDSDRFGGMNNFSASDRHRDIIIQHVGEAMLGPWPSFLPLPMSTLSHVNT